MLNVLDKMDNLVYIKCPKCGKVYRGKSDGNNDMDRTIRCSCGEDIEIEFSGPCTSCDKIVGFRLDFSWGELATDFTKSFLNGYLNPVNAVERFSRNFRYPKAKACGICPFCQRMYFLCPECNAAIHIRKDQEYEVAVCPNCGCNMIRG